MRKKKKSFVDNFVRAGSLVESRDSEKNTISFFSISIFIRCG